MALRRSVHIILNPAAGARNKSLLRDVMARLKRLGVEVTIEETVGPGDATRLAQRAALLRHVDVIVAAGGDGTINEVARGLQGQGVPLGIIPLGTANVLAIELGLPPRGLEVANMLIAGPARLVGTGLVDGSIFMLMIGIGFDGAVIRGVDPALKRRFGKAAVIWSGLKVWWRGPGTDIRLLVDGREKQAQWAIVLNGRYFAGPYVLSSKGDISMPGLTLFLFHNGSRFALARYLIALGLGRVEKLSDVEVLSARHIEARGTVDVGVEIDGDDRGQLPLIIEQGAHMLRLVVPQEWAP